MELVGQDLAVQLAVITGGFFFIVPFIALFFIVGNQKPNMKM